MVIKSNKPEIIIVDDEEANRFLFEHALSELDIHCIKLKSGEECIELLNKNSDYALILLDIKMPGLNGYEVLDIIRKEIKSDIPVILISAIFNSTTDIINGIEKGAMDLLTKPVNIKLLKHKVLNYIKLYDRKEALSRSVKALQSLSNQLQEKENRIRKITDAVEDAITVINQQGKILFWNQSARINFGYSKFEITNENILELIIAKRSSELLKNVLESINNDSNRSGNEQVHFIYAKNKLGLELPFEITITSYKKDKKNLNYVLVFRNLTKYLKLEKEVKKSKELKEANKVMREFVDNVSHEMRTPMNAILGISKMMLKYKSENLSKKQLEGLEIIKESGTRLLDLINDVLDLSKIDSGMQKVNNELFNFPKFIAHIKSITNNLIGDKKIKFLVKRSQSIPNEIIADQKKIHQILLNLIGNSVKFTEQGKIILTTHKLNDNLFFEISDTGIGISQDKLDTIFDKFVQADHSIAKKYKGTGLGLHITKKLVNILNGEITVESEPDKGTIISFYITLPAQPDNSKQYIENGNKISQNIDIISYTPKYPLVLIIDDNLQNAFLYYQLLEHHSFSILYCKDGKSGIKALHRYQPDSVIVKLELSDLYGLNIVNEIINSYPQIQVIVISEYDERPSALQSNIIFLGEPINIKILVDNLRTIKRNKYYFQSEIAIIYKNQTSFKDIIVKNKLYYIDLERLDLATIDLERQKFLNIFIEENVDKHNIIHIINQLIENQLDTLKSIAIENNMNVGILDEYNSLFNNIKELDRSHFIKELLTQINNKNA